MTHFLNDTRYMKIQAWKKSNDYFALCRTLDLEADCILQHAVECLRSQVIEGSVREEIGSKSDLHRGVYCPSPVYDIFVGNVKRGRLLKRLTSRSNNYYIYRFDENERLICAEHFINGKTITEHIFYTDSDVYGVILDNWGHISQCSHEAYDNGKISLYSRALFLHQDDVYVLMNLVKEQYLYDPKDLHQCIFTQYIPNPRVCQQTMYQLQYENNMPTKYTVSDIIGRNPYEILSTSREYDVHITREI